MKKLFFALAAVVLLATTSCSSDEPIANQSSDGDIDVTFSVSPDQLQTRALTASDGQLATQLTAIAFNEDGTKVAEAKDVMSELKGEITLRLVKGRFYKIAFWAQAEDAPYEFSGDGKKINISYKGALANDEKRDAFYALDTITVSKNGNAREITLKRPFAKVTVATTVEDFEAAKASQDNNGVPKFTSMSANVYSSFNLLEGDVDGSASNVDFAADRYVNDDGEIPVYDYNGGYIPICSSYIPVKNIGELNTIKFDYGDVVTSVSVPENEEEEAIESSEYNIIDNYEFTNVPVQSNYNTLIVGRFFTADANYNVIINPDFDLSQETVNGFDTELEKAVYAGESFTLDKNIVINNALVLNESAESEIDLGNHQLTIVSAAATGGGSTTISEGQSLTFKNGTIVVDQPGYGTAKSSFCIEKNGTIIVDNVTLKSEGCAIYPRGDSAKVDVKDSKIEAVSYGVSTNASTCDYYYVDINVENCEISAFTPILVNVPCNAKIKNCKLNGTVQGLFVRAGDVVVEDSEINLVEGWINESRIDWGKPDWGSGDNAPCAGITVGNKTSSAYQGPVNLSLSNTSVNGINLVNHDFPAIHACACSAKESDKVSITYNDSCSFNGPLVWEFDTFQENIFINGKSAVEFQPAE